MITFLVGLFVFSLVHTEVGPHLGALWRTLLEAAVAITVIKITAHVYASMSEAPKVIEGEGISKEAQENARFGRDD